MVNGRKGPPPLRSVAARRASRRKRRSEQSRHSVFLTCGLPVRAWVRRLGFNAKTQKREGATGTDKDKAVLFCAAVRSCVRLRGRGRRRIATKGNKEDKGRNWNRGFR